MKKITGMLREWGDFVSRNIDYADEYGDNILHKYAVLGCLPSVPGESKILCPDMPAKLHKIDLAVKKLPNLEEKCVSMWFCAPIKDDGNLWTKREIARLLGLSKYNFERNLRNGVKKLQNELT